MRPFFLVCIAVVLLASGAFASIGISPEVKNVNLSRNDSAGIRFELSNSGEEACISLEAEPEDDFIEATLLDDTICLNENGSTMVTVTVKTRNAPRGMHEFELRAEADGDEAEASIRVFVSEEPEIELVAYPNDVCRGQKDYINVLVRNNSDEFKEAELQAENEMLLPYFAQRNVSLMPNQEKYVKLWVHTSPYSALGRHTVSLYAITEDEIAKETVSLDVEECREEKPKFRLSVGSGCFTVEKGESEKIYFSVENETDEEQQVFFSAGGNLAAKLSQQSAWLEGNEERDFYIEVKVSEDAVVKDYNAALRVWNSDYGIQRSLCIRPERAHSVSLEPEQDVVTIEECKSAVFTLMARNIGDYSEDFELEIENDYSGIEAVLSEERFELGKHSSRQVYVSVNLSEGLGPGTYHIKVVGEAGREDFEEELTILVVEEIVALPGKVLVAGYASSVSMDANSEKSVFVTLWNNSEEKAEGISVMLLGLPAGVSSDSKNVSLQPGEKKVVELVLKALPGTKGEFDAELYIGNQDFSERKNVKVVVQETIEAQQPEEEGFIPAGLAVAGGTAILGLAVLIIIIIAFVLLARAFGKPNTQKEVWMRG